MRPRAKVLTSKPKPGAMPLGCGGHLDPDTPMNKVEYRKAQAPFAMPAEAYRYDIMYDAFRADKEFWEQWKVVECTRGVPGDMEDFSKACIRVVMDLPMSEKLHPVTYTPWAPARPAANSAIAAAAADANSLHEDDAPWVVSAP